MLTEKGGGGRLEEEGEEYFFSVKSYLPFFFRHPQTGYNNLITKSQLVRDLGQVSHYFFKKKET